MYQIWYSTKKNMQTFKWFKWSFFLHAPLDVQNIFRCLDTVWVGFYSELFLLKVWQNLHCFKVPPRLVWVASYWVSPHFTHATWIYIQYILPQNLISTLACYILRPKSSFLWELFYSIWMHFSRVIPNSVEDMKTNMDKSNICQTTFP